MALLLAATCVCLLPIAGPSQLPLGSLRALNIGQRSPGRDPGHTPVSGPIALPPATTPGLPAPSTLTAGPLSSRETFGFAPYWTLDDETSFDVSELTTIAYFGLNALPDGSLDKSGAGWDGYESQDLADLTTRAHAAGTRVVLTIVCFDDATLEALSDSTAAQQRLAANIATAVQAKNLDGVNLDFEGSGDGFREPFASFVDNLSDDLHADDPDWQVTLDTYSSAAADDGGFYDIAA
ncbi:MAG TPA: hypothetical protein VIA06_05715, partial [Candidatus Dormibacteraeota bacterium]|nr:hypothetical protein [Candidatus Dormibacteraeota bacterium]